MKQYTIKKYYRNTITEKTGTVEELIKYYSGLLSYSRKVIKNIKTLVRELNKCVEIQQACCYNREYFELKEE